MVSPQHYKEWASSTALNVRGPVGGVPSVAGVTKQAPSLGGKLHAVAASVSFGLPSLLATHRIHRHSRSILGREL